MKTIHLIGGAALALALAACAAMPGDDRPWYQQAFPRTTAGFQDGGVVGAVQGFTGGVLVICERLDAPEFSAAVDAVAVGFDVTGELEVARAWRRTICEQAAAVQLIANLATNPVIGTRAEPIAAAVSAEAAAAAGAAAIAEAAE